MAAIPLAAEDEKAFTIHVITCVSVSQVDVWPVLLLHKVCVVTWKSGKAVLSSMTDTAFACAQDLLTLTSAQASTSVQPQDSDQATLRCAREHCTGCGIWNQLLTGHCVSMHYPLLRAFALSHKALLGLHAQALAAGNTADAKVHGPAVSRMHGGQILGYLSLGFSVVMLGL